MRSDRYRRQKRISDHIHRLPEDRRTDDDHVHRSGDDLSPHSLWRILGIEGNTGFALILHRKEQVQDLLFFVTGV